MKGKIGMKLILAFVPVGILASVPYILQIRKFFKLPNPDMYE